MRIQFAHRDRPQRTVAVRGDFSQWKTSEPLVEVEPGVYRGELDLNPGVYQYKMVLDRQHWELDIASPWIDRTGESANNTLVVGGAEPPLFFAPSSQCWLLRDGQLAVHAEVETGCRIPRSLELHNDQGTVVAAHPVSLPLTVGNRHLVQSHGPVPAGAISAGFEGYPGTWALPAPTIDDRPEWLNGAVLYSIFLDRWRRGSQSTPDPRAVSRETPSTAEVLYGGDLYGVTETLDWIADLGVDAIVLTPIHSADSPHRYDAKDFEIVDPRLGGEKALSELIEACHSHGLRLILDAAWTHCHWQHEAFQELLRYQANAPRRDWFLVDHYPVTLTDPTSYHHYPGFVEQPMLDLGALPVVEYFKDLVKAWMQLGVDGLRFDAVEYGPSETWRALGACARQHNPNVALIAECVLESPGRAADEFGVHCVTDYSRHERLVRALRSGAGGFEAFLLTEQLLRHRLGPGRDQSALEFIDNHDTDRFLTRTGCENSLRVALEHLVRGNEPLLFYYGTELGLTSGKRTALRDLSWPDRLPMPPLPRHSAFTSWIRQLLRRRRDANSERTSLTPRLCARQNETRGAGTTVAC